ncbi:MAG: hypothetical protein U9R74_14655 [Pseudomonadota bacterium]|nr:hypothetical protein [Pseudomonadota bacterium]
MLKKLMTGAVAGILLAGASVAMARSVDAWLVAGVDSSSGTVAVESDVCMGAVAELRKLGFQFTAMAQLEPRLAALYFQSEADAAALFCVANIFEEQAGLLGE